MNLRAGLVVLMLAVGTLQAATASQPTTSSTQDAKVAVDEAVSAVKTLAESGNPAIQGFAAHLAKVLARHNVPVPKLPDALPTTAPAKLSEQERAMVKRAVDEHLWPAAFRVSPQVAYDLNVVAAEECPDITTRLGAVMFLNTPSQDPNVVIPEPVIAVRVTEKILAKAFEFQGDRLTDDAKVVLEMGAVMGGWLIGPYFQRKAMTLEPLTKESFEKAIGELLAHAEAASKAVKEGAELLDPWIKDLKEAQKESGHAVELGQALKAVTAVGKRMFDAMNKGDMAAYRDCFAGPVELDKEDPKKPEPKVRFVGLLVRNIVRGEDGKLKTIDSIIQWTEIDAKGRCTFLKEEMSFVYTPKGWLIEG